MKYSFKRSKMLIVLIVYLTILLYSCMHKTNEERSRKSVKFLPLLTDQILYKVNIVVDGDTYELLDSNNVKFKVRLIGADTPETKHPRKPVEKFGPEATKFCEELLTDKEVKLEFEKDTFDRYKRILAHVYIDSIHVNKMLIDSGLARTSFYSPNFEYEAEFINSEIKAKEKGIRIWSLKN